MVDNLQIIIPMSGIGERFLKAGYKLPKPLIHVEGKPIIEHVIDMFPAESDFIFICNDRHANDPQLNLKKTLKKCAKNCTIVTIEPHKLGPVFALQQAAEFIDDTKQTIVNYCDFYAVWDKSRFFEFLKDDEPDGVVFTYSGFHPHMLQSTNFAYVKKNAKGEINAIREKSSFTSNPMNEFASSGTYYFKSGAILKELVSDLIERNLKVNGEYYVSLLYQVMIEKKMKIKDFEIKFFMQWGTPEDFEEYLYFSKIFTKETSTTNKSHFSGINIVTMAGKGSRFKEAGYNIPKPLIEINGKPIFLKALDSMPRSNKTIVATTNDIADDVRRLMDLHDVKNSQLKLFSTTPEGQALSLLETLKSVPHNSAFNVIPCDSACVFNDDTELNLGSELSTDIVVWTVSGLPNAIKNPEMYSWVQLDKHGKFLEVSVKKMLGKPELDPIVSGFFSFRNKSIANLCIEKLLGSGLKTNNEFYLDACVNFAIELGFTVSSRELSTLKCWGTPNELRSYTYWNDCFDIMYPDRMRGG
jgi:NDP-sugar pyrophosphorylase family protein